MIATTTDEMIQQVLTGISKIAALKNHPNDEIIHPGDTQEERLDSLFKAVCRAREQDYLVVNSASRRREFAWTRRMFLAAAHYSFRYVTSTALGRYLSGRDHSTILHNLNMHATAMRYDFDYMEEYNKTMMAVQKIITFKIDPFND